MVVLGDNGAAVPSSGAFPNLFSMLRNRLYGSPEQEQPGVHYHVHYHPQPPPTQFRPPGQLDYSLNAGHIYGNDGSLRDLPCFKDDDYNAPSAARKGYTRSPADTMTLICPECSGELGKSVDALQKEVWVAKCGHVYCGSCAFGHRQNKGKGTKADKCLVDGCVRVISGLNGMMEVFL
jgi:hypothetical protein